MNLYLVSCSSKLLRKLDPPILQSTCDVFVIASDPSSAENLGFILARKINVEVNHVSNIKLIASTDENEADGLLAIE